MRAVILACLALALSFGAARAQSSVTPQDFSTQSVNADQTVIASGTTRRGGFCYSPSTSTQTWILSFTNADPASGPGQPGLFELRPGAYFFFPAYIMTAPLYAYNGSSSDWLNCTVLK